uniref:Uncharacterized protein n=1 Tax=Opuntia streptacantha TaxID=393608 RepID=A0A7C9ETM2_OPUST
MAMKRSTSNRVSPVEDGINRSLTVASSSCIPTLLANSILEDEEAFSKFAALSNFNRKLQETAPLSAGSKLTIDSSNNLYLEVFSPLISESTSGITCFEGSHFEA